MLRDPWQARVGCGPRNDPGHASRGFQRRHRFIHGAYSILIPAALTTFVHFAVSVCMSAMSRLKNRQAHENARGTAPARPAAGACAPTYPQILWISELSIFLLSRARGALRPARRRLVQRRPVCREAAHGFGKLGGIDRLAHVAVGAFGVGSPYVLVLRGRTEDHDRQAADRVVGADAAQELEPVHA